MKKTALVLLILYSFTSFSQEFDWWNEKHNWDGTTHWTQYLTLSPAFMGPNALPVPEFKNGIIYDKLNLEVSGDAHFSKGDKTQNLFTKLFIPLYENRVAFELRWVPIERFKTDTITRDLRVSRGRSGEGTATGDVYISTQFQLLKDHKKLPDILFSVNLKTTSGSKLTELRTTDTHGFWLDLSVGKDIQINGNLIKSVRPHFMGGFYGYQTLSLDQWQNDAPLYSVGLDLNIADKFTFKQGIGGYYGYLNNGDQPLVSRTELVTQSKNGVNFKTAFQYGIHDFPYKSLRVGVEFNLAEIEWNGSVVEGENLF